MKLTQLQINNIRKDFIKKIEDIDRLKISDEGKISLIVEFLKGYKRGFEISAGSIFDIKEVDFVYSLDRELAMFDKSIGQVEPSIEIIILIASSYWGEIIKIMKKIKI